MKTCAAFIHEYDAYDDFCEASCNFDREFAVAEFELAKAYHAADMNIFFEGEEGNANAKKAEANDSFLAKIGKMIENLIETLGRLIENITGKITGLGKSARSDKEKIEAILAKRPELAKDINVGLEKGWYTEKDVASFEKDTLGLLKLVEQGKMDHKTFHQKLLDRVKKFNEAAGEPAQACKNIKELFSVVPSVMDNCKKSSEGLMDSRNSLKNFLDKTKKQHDDNNYNYIKAGAEAWKEIADARAKKADSAKKAADQTASTLDRIAKALESWA